MTARSPEPSEGTHQNIARTVLALNALAQASDTGLRFTDVVAAIGLSKVTTHRLLSGLVEHGLADFHEETGRFFLGMRAYGWAVAAGDRFGIVRAAAPALDRLVHETEDTVYLMMRVGLDAICLERREGRFPIKTLTLSAGDRRPLGVGAAGMALLAPLPQAEIERILALRAADMQKFGLDAAILRRIAATARERGYARYDGEIIPNMSAIGIALMGTQDKPIASLSVAAISERMSPERSAAILASLREEAEAFQKRMAGRAV